MNQGHRKIFGAWTLAALAVTMSLLATTSYAAKDDENPHLWKPKVRSVSVFKNGLGFFVREGEVTLDKGWCLSKEIPPAAFGTLAIYSADKDKMVDIVGAGKGQVVAFDDVDAPATDVARRDRLTASLGLNLELTHKRDEETLSVAGKLKSVGPKYAILQASKSTFAVPIKAITKMAVLDLPIRVHLTNADNVDNAAKKSAVKPANGKAKLGMAYLRKGVTWIPEYSLRILDDDTAELTLRGTLINEAEDLVHCDVNFVVGVPHFVHTQYLAPIAVGQLIRSIGAHAAPANVRSQISNRAMLVRNSNVSPQIMERRVQPRSGNLSSATGNLPSLKGPGGTDYTVYTKKDLTVRRGEKAIVTLFRRKIKYSHIYRWALPGKLQHNLVLHNSTPTAWTTGPCLATSKGSPLSEDMLKYVPQGGSGELPVTTAINVANSQRETELKRAKKAYNPTNHTSGFLDLVTLQGKITVRNFEKKPIKVIITKTVPGKPTEVTDKGTISMDTNKLKLVSRQGTMSWTIEVDPGETKELTYVYERYVSSR